MLNNRISKPISYKIYYNQHHYIRLDRVSWWKHLSTRGSWIGLGGCITYQTTEGKYQIDKKKSIKLILEKKTLTSWAWFFSKKSGMSCWLILYICIYKHIWYNQSIQSMKLLINFPFCSSPSHLTIWKE